MLTITDNEFRKIVEYVNSHYGINLSEKKALVFGRLQNFLMQNSFSSFSEYFDCISSDKTGEMAANLINKLTTNHTFFLREIEHFYFMRDRVLPGLKSNIANRDMRIWSAGCSSGEEPYTIAMIISDYFGTEKVLWDSRILATDISTKVLDTAGKGIYSGDQISNIPENWKKNYFRRISDDSWTITDKIKDEIVFRRFNLKNSEFPFRKKFHVIFCRNVMIYFDQQTKRDLINRFYKYTEYGGYLFIGQSESIKYGESGYRYIMPAVFRKE